MWPNMLAVKLYYIFLVYMVDGSVMTFVFIRNELQNK